MGLATGDDEVHETDDLVRIPLISQRKQGNQLLRCALELQRWFWGNGIVCALTSAFVFSWSNLCSKLVHGPAFQVLLLEGIGSLIVLLPLSAVFKWSPIVGKAEKLLQLVCASVVYGIYLSCLFISMFKIPISDTSTIRSLNSTIVAFFLWAIKREPLGWPTVTGIATCIAGVVFVVRPRLLFGGVTEWTSDWTWGVVYAFLSAVFSASYLMSVRFIGPTVHPMTVQVWSNLGIVVLPALPLAIGWPEPMDWSMFTSLRADLFNVAAVATDLIGVLFYIRAVQLLFGAFAQALLSTGIVFVAVWEYLILGTPFTVLSWIGSLLMILGLFVVSFDSRPSQSTQKPEGCVLLEEEL